MKNLEDVQPLAAPEGGSPMKFPGAPYRLAASYFDGYIDEAARAAKSVEAAALDRAAEILLEAHSRGGLVYSCGNGGSAAIANHLQCDHMKSVRISTDLVARVVSLSTNVEVMTAIANDFGYEHVFVNQLQWHAQPGDVLMAISSSGRSANIIRALTWARDHGVGTIALTGFDGGEARRLAEVSIHVDAANYGVIEDMHQVIMHALAQYIRQSRMTADVVSASVF